jgi:hypothetical protein
MEVTDMKKDIKAWAIKLRGRSFHQAHDGVPFFYTTKANASVVAMRLRTLSDSPAEAIRVRVRVEEMP